jgi:hypothetical protein
VNATQNTLENAARQPHQSYSPQREDPLLGAKTANAQLKLCLRRLRADAAGSHRRTAITRLLDVAESVDRSLSWLNGVPDEPCRASAMDPELAELGKQLAIESGAMRDVVGVEQ